LHFKENSPTDIYQTDYSENLKKLPIRKLRLANYEMEYSVFTFRS